MRQVFGVLMLLLSGPLSAEVLTFECKPDNPATENRELNVFVVNTADNTLKMNNDVIFTGSDISEREISVEGQQDYLSYILEIYRQDLKYKKTQWLNAYENSIKRNFTGQCEIME